VRADGPVRVTLPAGLSGAHRIAVVDEDGTLIGWDNITVAALDELAHTGTDLGAPIRTALVLLLAGAGLLVLRRKRSIA
jgi:LPXTG-motif cell wall-anchored protein